VPTIGGLEDGSTLAPTALARVDGASTLMQTAQSDCQTGNLRHTKRDLKGALKQLTRLRTLLKSKRAKNLPQAVHDDLLTTCVGLRDDVHALRHAIACPADAS
jgi:hypothetical protein